MRMPAATFASLAATPSRLFVLFEAPGVSSSSRSRASSSRWAVASESARHASGVHASPSWSFGSPPSPRAVGWGEASVARRGGGGVRWELREPAAPTERSLDHVHVLKSLFALS